MQVSEKNTFSKHHESLIKNKCRETLLASIAEMFPKAETLNTFTLGGERLMTEQMLSEFYELNGVSYEYNATSVPNARKNAPKGIKVIEGNIFNHKYKGTEQFIWFDFTEPLRDGKVEQLLKWITINPLTTDCIFATTYTLHCREKGQGYKQLFANEEEHTNFIYDKAYEIALYLENEFVYVEPSISIIRYCNIDVDKKSLPMVQFIFKIRKK
jgi:hypothetical protein